MSIRRSVIKHRRLTAGVAASGPVTFLAVGAGPPLAGIGDDLIGAAYQARLQALQTAIPIVGALFSDRSLKTDVTPVRWDR